MKKSFLAVGMVILTIMQGIMPVTASENSALESNQNASDTVFTVSDAVISSDYTEYVEKNGGIEYGNDSQIVLAKDGVKLNSETTSHSFVFSCEEDGWYTIKWEYKSIGSESNNHQLGIYVDGKCPYSALSIQEIPRMWLAGEISVLENGTQVRGDVALDTEWASYTVYDNTGILADPYMIYLTSGEHEVKLRWIDGNIMLRNITLFGYEKLIGYDEYSKKYSEIYDGKPLNTIEAESFVRANSLSVTAASDLSSPHTTPYSYSDQLLNVMGGSNWQYTGQRVEWNVSVPESGLYNITIRYKQSYKTNMNTYRKLLVNGQVPFSEAMAIPFAYDSDWQYFQPDWAIWLNKGENILALEVTSGESAVIINGVNDAVQRLNTLYRRIIMLTGTSPDSYRDYYLDDEIPGIREEFKEIAGVLGDQLKNVENIYGSLSSFSVLQDTKRQLEDMAADLRSVTQNGRLDRFKSNISSLASLGQSLREQALQIDSLTLSSPKNPIKIKSMGFFGKMKHKFLRFLASFSGEYSNSIGSSKKDSITVWTSLGRDQLGILQSMTANDFEPRYNMDVEVQLVTGSLIQAVLAGKGPDIVLGQAETDVINYAMRDALVDLKNFDDYAAITENFLPEATKPFTYKAGTYALPQTQTFQMMFVRNDILEELKLEIPKTWTDFVTEIFPVLQRDNLLVGVGNLNNAGALTGIFLTLLYQYNGSLYSEDLLSSALTTPQALEAFDLAVSLYDEYGVPTEYNFLNRFRTGEMPIAISDYSTYNQLQIGAPEIAGLWTMHPIPGVLQDDGSINNTQILTYTGTIMLADAKDKEACWKFMKWWSSADVQQSFGLQQEAVLGPSGRYTPANLEALSGLSWGSNQLSLLREQMEVSTALTHVPGSYYIGKSINSATVTSVNDSTLIPREELMYWSELINREMKRKQKEFNFTGNIDLGEEKKQ